MVRACAQTKTHAPKLVAHDQTGKSNKLAGAIGNFDDGLVNVVDAALRARRHRRADSRWGAQINDLGDKKNRHLEELQTKKRGSRAPPRSHSNHYRPVVNSGYASRPHSEMSEPSYSSSSETRTGVMKPMTLNVTKEATKTQPKIVAAPIN